MISQTLGSSNRGGSKKFDFLFDPAVISKTGKHKNVLASANNIPSWYRFKKTKIKKLFKEELSEWVVPQNDSGIVRYEGTFIFQIIRNNGYNVDSDALCISSYKWIIDLFVEKGWLYDDDNTTIILLPTLLYSDGVDRTRVHLKLKLKRNINMKIEELKKIAQSIVDELEDVGGENHVKAASLRVRIALGKIKASTAQLRADFVKLDKAKK